MFTQPQPLQVSVPRPTCLTKYSCFQLLAPLEAPMGFPSSIRDPWETASSWTPHEGRRCLSQDGSILAGFCCFVLGIPTVSAPQSSSCPLGFFSVPPRPPGLDLSIPSLDSSGHSHPQHHPCAYIQAFHSPSTVLLPQALAQLRYLRPDVSNTPSMLRFAAHLPGLVRTAFLHSFAVNKALQ